MLGQKLVVVADAHLGVASWESDARFLDFLEEVPRLGDALLINGDLFDFWFSYRRAIPRAGFQAAAAVAVLARKIPVLMTGGNHDRWGDTFWAQDAGVQFSSGELRFEAAGSRVLAVHGDGLAEEHRSAIVMHRITRHPLTVRLYRLLHPDFGVWLVDKMSHRLADSTRNPAVLDRAQARQVVWARERMAADPSIGLLVMSHTHRPAVVDIGPGRRYLNPGAWVEDYRYAVVTAESIDLRQF